MTADFLHRLRARLPIRLRIDLLVLVSNRVIAWPRPALVPFVTTHQKYCESLVLLGNARGCHAKIASE